jgi:hypothetical protein
MDVFATKPSWANPNPVVWEVKVTRQDFRGDTQTGKYRRYLPFCRRLYFACPSGLLKKEDIPEGMGLTVRGENGWHVVKAPKVRAQPERFHEIVFSLLLKVHPDGFSPPTRIERIRRMTEAEDVYKARFHLPKKFEALASETLHMKGELENAIRTVARELEVEVPEGDWALTGLVQEVLKRAPKAPGPFNQSFGGIRANLETIVRSVGRVAEVLDKLEGSTP